LVTFLISTALEVKTKGHCGQGNGNQNNEDKSQQYAVADFGLRSSVTLSISRISCWPVKGKIGNEWPKVFILC